MENQEMETNETNETNEKIEYRIFLKEIKGTNNVENWIEEIKKELDNKQIKYDIREPTNKLKKIKGGNGNQPTYPYAYFENALDKLNSYIRFKSSNTVLKKKNNTISNLFKRFVSNKKEEPIGEPIGEPKEEPKESEHHEEMEQQEDQVQEQNQRGQLQGEPKVIHQDEEQYHYDEESLPESDIQMKEIIIYIEEKKVPNLIKKMKNIDRFRDTNDFTNGFK